MEFKINMSKVNKLLNCFIQDNFTFDYQKDDLKINDYLNNDYKELLESKRYDFTAYLRDNSVTCTACEPSLNSLTLRDNTIELEGSFTLNKVYQANASEQYNFKLILNQLNDEYEITNINLYTREGVVNYGFHLVDLLKKRIRIAKPQGNKITLAVLVRNEADKFLKRMLTHAMRYVSNIVILDDASTDCTVQVCEEILKDFPHKIYINDEPMIQNLRESECKIKLWNLTILENPDWILLLDADEIFEDWAISVLPWLVNDVNFDAYYLKMYHMWDDEEHHRVDGLWRPYNSSPYLLRYQPNYEYKWNIKELHSSRYPYNVWSMPGCFCLVKLKHYGYFTKEIRKAKYERYKILDPDGKFESSQHYASILDENPNLERV